MEINVYLLSEKVWEWSSSSNLGIGHVYCLGTEEIGLATGITESDDDWSRRFLADDEHDQGDDQ